MWIKPRTWKRTATVAVAAVLTAFALSSTTVAADELVDMARQLGVSELRAGVMLHDVETSYMNPLLALPESIDPNKWQNLSLEILFRPPDSDWMRWIGSPRIGLETSLNFVGKESYARLSSVWHLPILDTPFFYEPMLGATVHDGILRNAPPGRRNLGCRFLFQYGFNLGVDLSDTTTLMMTVEHSSHLWLCGADVNDGINRAGIRMGFKLD